MVSDQKVLSDRGRTINDQRAGTVNFAHLSPFYCVSIGFVVEGRPVIGVINAPFLHQTFSARRGKGAWLNETQRLPLLRSVTLRGPSMNSRNLSLQHRVNKTMTRKHVLALKLRGDDHRLESLTTTAYINQQTTPSK